MKNLYLLFLSILLMISCIGKHTEGVAYEGVFEIYEINIPIPDTAYASYPKHQIYKNFFIGLNPFNEPNILTLIDIENKLLVKKIKIDPNFFKSSIFSFYVHNLDSIFFNSHQNNLVYLIDEKGQKINEWAIDFEVEELAHDPAGFMFPSFTLYDRLIYDPLRKSLFASLISQRYHERSGDEDPNMIVEIDLGTSEITNVISASLGKMKNRDKKFYPDDISIPQFYVVANSLYISYPIDPVIYEYGLENKQFKEFDEILENNLGFSPPMEYDIKKDRKKSWEYRNITPFFENLNYHQDLGVFSRIFHHENLPDIEGKFNGHLRSSSIFIFDKDLRLIEQKIIEGGQLGVFKSTPLSDGWLIAPNEYYKDSETAFHHSFRYKYIHL